VQTRNLEKEYRHYNQFAETSKTSTILFTEVTKSHSRLVNVTRSHFKGAGLNTGLNLKFSDFHGNFCICLFFHGEYGVQFFHGGSN
jgi:hypothetical protein